MMCRAEQTVMPTEVVRLARAVLGRREARFHAGVWAAYLRGRDEIGRRLVLVRCPACDGWLDVRERSARRTLAGVEPACIQYGCERCGLGGEREL